MNENDIDTGQPADPYKMDTMVHADSCKMDTDQTTGPSKINTRQPPVPNKIENGQPAGSNEMENKQRRESIEIENGNPAVSTKINTWKDAGPTKMETGQPPCPNNISPMQAAEPPETATRQPSAPCSEPPKGDCQKDPMRDSLMSNSDPGDVFSDVIDEIIEHINDGGSRLPSEASGANSLDLELDLWEGQFDFSATNAYYDSVFSARNGFPFYKDVIKTVQMLQQQVGVLAENQVNTDDRYSRVKQDNSALQARVMMLEEQLRETEVRSEDRLSDEHRRNKELIARVEREKLLTVENYAIKHTNLEKEKNALVADNQRLKAQLEKLQREKCELEDRVSEAEFGSSALQRENAKMGETSKREKEELRIERERGSQVIEELRCEVERLRAVEESYRKRSPSVDSATGSTAEMEAELKRLKEHNKQLSEQVEELHTQLLTTRLEEGRTLVSATTNSLAAEFEQMTSDELRKSLKDSQEANHHLKAYIDGILLNIVENYPQLLEVKHK